MVQTFSDGKKIYSVDMMFAYINLFNPNITYLDTEKFKNTLLYKGWGDPIKKIKYSPADVLKNPKKKEYENDIQRIKNADLKYPIIVFNNHIVDGVHRYVKTIQEKKKEIKAYIFDKETMEKFLINDKGDWELITKMKTYDYIEIFFRKFNKKPI